MVMCGTNRRSGTCITNTRGNSACHDAMSDLLGGHCDGCVSGSTLLVCQLGLAASPGFTVCVSVSGREVETYMLSMRCKWGPIV